MKKKFKKEFLLENVLWDVADDVEVIQDKVVGQSRWSTQHQLIFRYEDKYWQTHYSAGSTEMQDESPWEYEGDEIECTEVAPVEQVVIVYKPV